MAVAESKNLVLENEEVKRREVLENISKLDLRSSTSR